MDIYVVDSFTDAAFGGNPAAVVLPDTPAEADWMQAVAAEMKHSETAFVVLGAFPVNRNHRRISTDAASTVPENRFGARPMTATTK